MPSQIKTKAQRTPGPWKTNEDNSIIYASKREICAIANYGSPVKQDRIRKANAEFIVLACNSHDKLVEALKLALKTGKFYDENAIRDRETVPNIIKEALKAVGE